MPLLDTDPLDLLLDSSGELVIENGDIPLSRGLEGVAQAIRISVLLVRGEWFLNLDAGVPYLARDGVTTAEAILGQQFDSVKVTSAFRDAILRAAGVFSIDSINAAFEPTTRTMTVRWQVSTVFGGTVSDSLARSI